MIVLAPTMGHMIQTTHDLVPADMWPLIDNIVCLELSISITCPVTMWDSAPPDKGCVKKFEDPKKNASFKSIDCELNAKK